MWKCSYFSQLLTYLYFDKMANTLRYSSPLVYSVYTKLQFVPPPLCQNVTIKQKLDFKHHTVETCCASATLYLLIDWTLFLRTLQDLPFSLSGRGCGYFSCYSSRKVYNKYLLNSVMHSNSSERWWTLVGFRFSAVNLYYFPLRFVAFAI